MNILGKVLYNLGVGRIFSNKPGTHKGKDLLYHIRYLNIRWEETPQTSLEIIADGEKYLSFARQLKGPRVARITHDPSMESLQINWEKSNNRKMEKTSLQKRKY